MKKILFFLTFTFLVNNVLNSQGYPVVQQLGSNNTLIRLGTTYGGALKGNLIQGVYADTTEANTGYIDGYPGAIIFTTGNSTMYVRNAAATGWIGLASGLSAINIYNSDGTLSGDRILTGGSRSLTFTGLSDFRMEDVTAEIIIGNSATNRLRISSGFGAFLSLDADSVLMTRLPQSQLLSTDSVLVRTADFKVKTRAVSSIGSTYTAPLTESSGTVGLAGLTTVGTNGQLIQSNGTTWEYVNPSTLSTVNNGLVKNSSGVVGLDSAGVNPLGRDVLIRGNNKNFTIDSTFLLDLSAINYLAGTRKARLQLKPQDDNTEGLRLSYEDLIGENYISMETGLIRIHPSDNQLFIDNIPSTSSTTGRKVALIDTATGKVERIDPATLVTTPTLQQVLTAGSTLTKNDTIYLNSYHLRILNNGEKYLVIDPTLNNEYAEFRSYNPTEVNDARLKVKTTNLLSNGQFEADFGDGVNVSRVELQSSSGVSKVILNAYNYGGGVNGSYLYVDLDSIYLRPEKGALNIDTLRTWSGISDTTYKKPMTWDTRNGRWEYAANWPQQKINLVFGAGSGADADTTAFTTSAIYGSFYNDADTIVVTSMRAVLQGTSPDITYKVWYNDSLNVEAGATALVTAGSQVTNTTTGTNVTSFDATKIPPGVWVWVKTSTVATKPKYFSLTVNGYRK